MAMRFAVGVEGQLMFRISCSRFVPVSFERVRVVHFEDTLILVFDLSFLAFRVGVRFSCAVLNYFLFSFQEFPSDFIPLNVLLVYAAETISVFRCYFLTKLPGPLFLLFGLKNNSTRGMFRSINFTVFSVFCRDIVQTVVIIFPRVSLIALLATLY